jgi:hypothetical protein
MKPRGAGRKIEVPLLALALLLSSSLLTRTETRAADQNPTARSSDFDLLSYQAELARIRQAGKNPRDIRDIRRTLPENWTVKCGDQVYFVPTREIADALRQIEAGKNQATAGQLEARLKSMQRQAEELGSAQRANRVDAGAKLSNILSRKEFQEASGPSVWDQWRARVNRWILLHLIRLLNLVHISQRTGNMLAWAVLFLAVVALFYVAYRWLSKSDELANLRAEARSPASDARCWIADAFRAADRGDFREAIHCGYWAAVAHLEDNRMLPRDRARTPRESLFLLEHYPKEQGVLQVITHSFELVWYGYRPVSVAEWLGTKEQLESMGCREASIAPTAPS